MADTNLYNVLNGLHTTDERLWGKIKGLSGNVSGSFTNGKVAVGDGSKLTASDYEIGTTASADFGAANKLATEAGAKSFVSGQIDILKANINEIGGAVLSSTASGAALSTSVSNHIVNYTLTTDNTTIGQDGGALKSLLTLTKLHSPNAAYAAQYQLQNSAGTAIGDTINIPKDQFLSGVTYDATREELNFTFIIADGEGDTTAQNLTVPVSSMVHEYQGSDAINVAETPDGKSTISLKKDGSSESFLSITSSGLKLSGVQTAIDTAVAAASGNADDRIDALSSALNGYTAADAVKDKFTSVEGEITYISGKFGTPFNNSQIVATNASGQLTTTGKTAGGAIFANTPSENTLATEKGVSAYFATNSAKDVTTDGTLTSDHIVLGAGNKTVKDSSYTIKSGTALSDFTGSSTSVPTESTISAYINADLPELKTAIDNLNTEIGA